MSLAPYVYVTNGIVGKMIRIDPATIPPHKAHLLKPLIDEGPPVYDQTTHTLQKSFDVQENAVVVVYTVIQIPVSVALIKQECQRRIIALVGARDFADCLIKQLNANMRATELNDICLNGGTWTPEETAEATALRALAVEIKRLRACSNVLEVSLPNDYLDNGHW